MKYLSSNLIKVVIFWSFLSAMSAGLLNASQNQSVELIAHKQIGSGKEKVVVMHSWTTDSKSYDYMIPYLNTDDYTYVFVDLRGYGGSKEMQGKYTVEEAGSDTLKLVDFLGWDTFHLIGHSMSGMVVQKMALDNPVRVKSLIAITSVPACGTSGPKEIMNYFADMAVDNDKTAIEFVNRLTGNRYTSSFAAKMIAESRHHSTKEARLGYMNMFFQTDFSESIMGLQTPILVLFGEYDGGMLNEGLMLNTFMKWFPNAQLECCKGSGHYPMIETPIALVAAIEKFLSLHSTGG